MTLSRPIHSEPLSVPLTRMLVRYLFCLSLFVLLTSAQGSAQVSGQGSAQVSAQGTAPPGLIPRPAPAPAYVLGAGDQLALHVMDMDEISDKPLRIDSAGFIDVPLAGKIQAAGLTLDQLKTELASKLSKYIQSPEISINLTEDQNHTVSVVGSVNTPGTHEVQGPKRLLEVVSMAGGVRPDAGPRLILTRQLKWGPIPLPGAKTDASNAYSVASISLDNLLHATEPADNILVEPNDVISIPKADAVYVVGDVKKAGGFELSTHESMSIIQALALAQGLDKDNAASRSRILRPAPGGDGKPKEIAVNIPRILSGADPDMPLYPNDVLYIPNSAGKATARRSAEAILAIVTGLIIFTPL